MQRAAVLVPVSCLVVAQAALPGAQQVPRVVERVDVARVLIDVRVVDGRGQPVRGLDGADFRVEIDGEPRRVESASWIEGGAVDEDGEPWASSRTSPSSAGPPGRLIVFLFQKDLEPSRISGLMRMLIEARSFLDTFSPRDRVAVTSFDSHLKIWVDFTNDLARVRRIFERGILLERPGPVDQADGPSLVERLDTVRARKAWSMEDALLHIARALQPLPGAKSLVIVGHGFGRFDGSVVTFQREYAEARRAFESGRVTVFALDTTVADRHTLEAGLIRIAEDTGGFFARTHQFAGQALDRLAGALAGHYVLFVEVPEPLRGRHRLEVEAVGGAGTVLARTVLIG